MTCTYIAYTDKENKENESLERLEIEADRISRQLDAQRELMDAINEE